MATEMLIADLRCISPGVALIELSADFGSTPEYQLMNDMEPLLATITDPEKSLSCIVVDFSFVGPFGAAAISLFLKMHKIARLRKAHLYFVEANGTVRQILRNTELDELWDFHDTLGDALQANQPTDA